MEALSLLGGGLGGVPCTPSLIRVRYIMLVKFEYYAFERHPKKPSIMPEIMLEKYSIMLT